MTEWNTTDYQAQVANARLCLAFGWYWPDAPCDAPFEFDNLLPVPL